MGITAKRLRGLFAGASLLAMAACAGSPPPNTSSSLTAPSSAAPSQTTAPTAAAPEQHGGWYNFIHLNWFRNSNTAPTEATASFIAPREPVKVEKLPLLPGTTAAPATASASVTLPQPASTTAAARPPATHLTRPPKAAAPAVVDMTEHDTQIISGVATSLTDFAVAIATGAELSAQPTGVGSDQIETAEQKIATLIGKLQKAASDARNAAVQNAANFMKQAADDAANGIPKVTVPPGPNHDALQTAQNAIYNIIGIVHDNAVHKTQVKDNQWYLWRGGILAAFVLAGGFLYRNLKNKEVIAANARATAAEVALIKVTTPETPLSTLTSDVAQASATAFTPDEITRLEALDNHLNKTRSGLYRSAQIDERNRNAGLEIFAKKEVGSSEEFRAGIIKPNGIHAYSEEDHAIEIMVESMLRMRGSNIIAKDGLGAVLKEGNQVWGKLEASVKRILERDVSVRAPDGKDITQITLNGTVFKKPAPPACPARSGAKFTMEPGPA